MNAALIISCSCKTNVMWTDVGENVREFFFRVASLAFEANVLAELEKSGLRKIGDIVGEYPDLQLFCLFSLLVYISNSVKAPCPEWMNSAVWNSHNASMLSFCFRN